jgi:aryl-alcohol dehydrogenase-like predicted oxidoreductase
MEIRGPRVWGGRVVSDEEVERILNAVLDAGVNFIDTSWDYGLSEEYIGRFISHRRSEYYLATKCGCAFLNKGAYDETPHVWTRDNLRKNIEDSLRRMKTDYIDIWQLHNPKPEQVQSENLVEFMEQVKQEGKTRHISISSTLPYLPTYLEWNAFDTYQIPYSALESEHEEMISAAHAAQAGVIVRGGVARGEPGVGLGHKKRWQNWKQAKLEELLDPKESRTAFLLRFTISHPQMHTTIVGTKNPNHLAENLRALEMGPLSPEIYEEAKRRLKHPKVGALGEDS